MSIRSTKSPDGLRRRRRRSRHVTVELISHPEIARLEARDEALRAEIRSLQQQLDGNRKLLFDFVEAYGSTRR